MKIFNIDIKWYLIFHGYLLFLDHNFGAWGQNQTNMYMWDRCRIHFWNATIKNKNCSLRMQNTVLINAGNILHLLTSVYANLSITQLSLEIHQNDIFIKQPMRLVQSNFVMELQWLKPLSKNKSPVAWNSLPFSSDAISSWKTLIIV